MSIVIKLLSIVNPWPTRKKPQARFDTEVKAAMDQMSVMVGDLNGDFIPKVNQIAVQVANDANTTAINAANAKASETAAKSSQLSAKNSEINAKASSTAAKASENAAIKYADNARESASAAYSSEKNAKQSELNARASELEAKQSELIAVNCANKARASEVNAKASEIAAGKSAGCAKASEWSARASAELAHNERERSEEAALICQDEAIKSEHAATTAALKSLQAGRAADMSLRFGALSDTNSYRAKAYALLARTAQKDCQAERQIILEKSRKTDREYKHFLESREELLHTSAKVETESFKAKVWGMFAFVCSNAISAKMAHINEEISGLDGALINQRLDGQALALAGYQSELVKFAALFAKNNIA